MTKVASRYLILSPTAYRDPGGRKVRFAYSARRARLEALDPESAAALEDGGLDRLSPQQLDRLARLDAIVDDSADELSAVLAGYTAGSADRRTRGFTIMPTAYCNMACEYCGQEHHKAAVDQPAMERVAARVEAAIADPGTEQVTVTWFGGEPLLALRVIRELSGRFVAAAQAAGTRYGARMATNGSLLSTRNLEQLHHEFKLNSIDVTIDGPQRTHDQRRRMRNGSGTFGHTIGVLAGVVRRRSAPGLRIGIRVNIDADNEDTVADLITDLACFGLASPQVELHLMPVHSWGNDVSAVELEARRYAAREAGWLRQAAELGIGLNLLPGATKRTTCCATTTSSEIIDSKQRIYACSEHPLVPGVRESGIVARVADLTGSAPRPKGLFDDWFSQVGDGEQQCGRCPLLPVCGGSCPKLWREGHMPCPSMKFNWHERVDLVARSQGYQPIEGA